MLATDLGVVFDFSSTPSSELISKASWLGFTSIGPFSKVNFDFCIL